MLVEVPAGKRLPAIDLDALFKKNLAHPGEGGSDIVPDPTGLQKSS
jgi:hypothetical protein